MKSAIVVTVLSFLALENNALASQSAQVSLSAQESIRSVQITDQSFEPIYAQEPYQTTCSREVVDRTEERCQTYHDSVCSGGGEVCSTTNDSVCNSSGCTTVPRRSCHTTPRSCHDVPRRSCSTHNVYRTDYYSCTQTRTIVVGQRLVKTFNHQIEVALENAAVLGYASLQIEVNVSGNSVSARLSNSFSRNILNYSVVSLSEADAGSVLNSSKKIIISLGLSAEAISKILNSSLQSLELGRNALRFALPGMSKLSQNLHIRIELVRNRAIGGDSVLYSGSIASSSLSLVGAGDGLIVLIPYEKLGIESINSLKHDLAVSVSLNTGNSLNSADFSAALNKRLGNSLKKVKASF